MKTRKLLKILTQFISADRRAQMKNIKSIQHVLKELKKKENRFKDKLAKEKNQKEYEEIETKLRVIYAQRKKGVTLLKELQDK